MGRVIQMVFISEETSIFITDVTTDTITFRSSRLPEQQKISKIERIDENGIAWFDNYRCHINWLNKFITVNQDVV